MSAEMPWRRTILGLCGGTGSWAQPYEDAGYDVQRIELKDGQDVRLLRFPGPVHGVLAAPPCTYLCRMRMCRGRPTDAQFLEAMSVVDACLRIATMTRPVFWALENPEGYLTQWLGQPRLKFDPCDYGDPWTKKTYLWGDFKAPITNPVAALGSWVKKHANEGPLKQTNIAKTTEERSTTAPGFARAFFEANP